MSRRPLPAPAQAAGPLALGALVLLLVLGTGVVLLGTGPAAPAPATEPDTGGAVSPSRPSVAGASGRAASGTGAAALTLLRAATVAVRERAWSGTERVSVWSDGTATSAVLAVSHTSTAGTHVQALQADGTVLPMPSVAVDADLLGRLGDRYALSVARDDACAGRPAQVVEMRTAAGRLAGRFWLDRDTGLPLRREVWDGAGDLLRSSALENVTVAAGPPSVAPASAVRQPASATGPSRLPPGSAGWDVPGQLVGGFLLYATDRPARGAVLHLSYSDGLSAVSVFSQPGDVGSGPGSGYLRSTDGGSRIWVRAGSPQRVVWGGAGQVFTLVSDAGPAETLAAVRSLPHDPPPAGGLTARVGRGAARIGSWLDPTG